MRMEKSTERRREKERERKKEGQDGDGTPGYPPRVNQFREHRACVCARVRVYVNVCREAYPPVERGTDESVELSAHPTPRAPLKSTPPIVTKPPPSLSACHRLFPLTSRPSIPPRTIPTPPATVTTSRDCVPCTKAKVTRAHIDERIEITLKNVAVNKI